MKMVSKRFAPSVEICLMATYLQPNSLENCHVQEFWQVMKFI